MQTNPRGKFRAINKYGSFILYFYFALSLFFKFYKVSKNSIYFIYLFK